MRKIKKFFRLILQNVRALHYKVWGRGWKRLLLAIVVTLTIITALLVVSVEVTSSPKFCNTCHNMKPYYQSWLKSSHKDVTCTDCHFPPGIKNKIKGKLTAVSMLVNYFTGVYKKSKPWAEISDLSCMRIGCHETRKLSGKVKYKKNITFDHEPHLKNLRRGKKLRCTSCHSQIVQGSHISVTESTCFLCHFKDVDPEKKNTISKCTKCHTPPIKIEGQKEKVVYDHRFVKEKSIPCQKCHGEMVVGDGAVLKIRCNNCHFEREKIKQFNNTELMHKNHIADHKIECDQCHTAIQHKSVARTEFVKPDCNSCHPDFHKTQLDLFTGKSGKGVPLHPSPMFSAGLNCQACHIYHKNAEGFIDKGESMIAKGESCDTCHGVGYSKLLDSWKKQSDLKLAQIDKVLVFANKVLKRNINTAGYSNAIKKIEDADYNIKLVTYGLPIHNISFSNKLLSKAYDLITESLKETGFAGKIPDFYRETDINPGLCSNCHVDIENKENKIFGWTFTHKPHLQNQKLKCDKCHSNEAGHGQLIIAKNDCMDCHHKEGEGEKSISCKNCHTTQYALYYSKLPHTTYNTPNSMFNDVGCIDCHQDEDEKLLRPGKAICSKCHEKDYEDMFTEWQQSGIDIIKKLRGRVEKDKLRKGDAAYDLLKLLEKDGSKGIHNPELYDKLYEEALIR